MLGLEIDRGSILRSAASLRLVGEPIRNRLLRAAGTDIDPTVRVMPGLALGEGPLVIGPGSVISWQCIFDASGGIYLGSRVGIGQRCQLITAYHEVGPPECRWGERLLSPITIEDGVWMGANVVVLSGVTVGRGAVIAAGTLVRSDIPPNELWAGVPARFIRKLNP